MPLLTPKPDEPCTIYTTRHLPLSYLDRARMQGAMRRTTIEDIMNNAIRIGLEALELEAGEQVDG